MDMSANTIQNNALAAFASHAPKNVLNSIAKASAHTGVNFAYLMQQASAESSFKSTAKAKGSSASGLYQFIDSTWMNMVKKYGDKYGMGNLASQIDDSGHVDSKAVKQQILALRNDPEKASAMAAEFANDNKNYLKSNWGGKVGSTELYLAHFLGAGQAAEFLKARDDNPVQQAAVLFPKAAQANRNVFYDTTTGRPKTMDEVYAFFDKKFELKSNDIPAVAQGGLQMADSSSSNTSSTASSAQALNDIYSGVFASGHHATANVGGIGGSFLGLTSANNLLSNPIDVMTLSALDLPGGVKNKEDGSPNF